MASGSGVAPTGVPFELLAGASLAGSEHVLTDTSLPVGVMQEKITFICEELREKFTDAAELAAVDLDRFLTKLRPMTASIAIEYIKERDSKLDPSDPKGSYSQLILTALTTIRHNHITDNIQSERIKFTGTIRPADTMCLFVCGFLAYPPMTFSVWVSTDESEHYTDQFFDYMIENLGKTIQVQAIGPTTSTAEFDKIDQEAVKVSGSCFI